MEDPGKHNRNLWHWKFWAGILRGAIKAVLFTIAFYLIILIILLSGSFIVNL